MSWNRKCMHWRFTIWTGSSECPMNPKKFMSIPGLQDWYGNPEVCPTTGRFHWQCHADFDTAYRRKEVIKLLDHPLTTHYLRADHPQQSRDYCKKSRTRAKGMKSFHFTYDSDGNVDPLADQHTVSEAGPSDGSASGPTLPVMPACNCLIKHLPCCTYV